jgi:hypothetical protein
MNAGKLWNSIVMQRGKAFGFMIIGALLAFEIFNYSTTEFALKDVLGNLSFAGLTWATILSIAFCGIDFAGIARLFTPEQGRDEPAEIWYLFGAWVLAATMNAALTWWGVSVAIANHTSAGSAVISNSTIQTVVPLFVAGMVLVIRVLIIGTFSVAGERMFMGTARRTYSQQQSLPARNDRPNPESARAGNPGAGRPIRPAINTGSTSTTAARPIIAPASSFRPQPKPAQRPESTYTHTPVEPTYHNLMSSRSADTYLDERP